MIKTLKSKVRFEAAVFLNFMNRATKQFVALRRNTNRRQRRVYIFEKDKKSIFQFECKWHDGVLGLPRKQKNGMVLDQTWTICSIVHPSYSWIASLWGITKFSQKFCRDAEASYCAVMAIAKISIKWMPSIIIIWKCFFNADK